MLVRCLQELDGSTLNPRTLVVDKTAFFDILGFNEVSFKYLKDFCDFPSLVIPYKSLMFIT